MGRCRMNEVRQESLKHVWETLFHTPYDEDIKAYVLSEEEFKQKYKKTYNGEEPDKNDTKCYGFVNTMNKTIYLRATPEYEKLIRGLKPIELKVPNLALYLIHELIHLHLSEVLNNPELIGRVK
jgi:hypothetical protein